MSGVAMTHTHTYIANHGTNAWLRNFEQLKGIRIGERMKSWPIHLRQHIGFGCEPRALVLHGEKTEVPEMIWNDFGLFGPTGPLPELFTERILHSAEGLSLLQFVDGLIQRLAHLHYRAWASNRPECDNAGRVKGFHCFLNDLSGQAATRYPHLAWLKPDPSLLPLMVRKAMHIEITLEQLPVRHVVNEHAFKLGQHRLGQFVMGKQMCIYGVASRLFKITIKPESPHEFEAWRDPIGLLRQQLARMLQICMPTMQADIHVIPVITRKGSQLGRSKLGRACLTSSNSKTDVKALEEFNS